MNIKNTLNYLLSAEGSKTENLRNIVLDLIETNKINVSEQEKHFLELLNGEGTLTPDYIDLERQKFKEAIFSDKKIISIAAPTSFGKTYLVNEKVAYVKSAVIITPTISLSNEYFFNLIDKLSSKPSMSPFIKANYYILTPEKTLQLFEKNYTFDLMVFDEFYDCYSSLRTPIFKEVFKIANKKSKQIIMITPAGVQMFLDKKNIVENLIVSTKSVTTRNYKFFIYDKSKNLTKLYIMSELYSNNWILHKTYNGEISILEGIEHFSKSINKAPDRNILVLTSKANMYKLTEELNKTKNISFISESEIVKEAINYMKCFSPDTMLQKCLKKGIAYHNGSMDKYLRLLIEKAFEKGDIKILFANNTVTKGVNLNPSILLIDKFTSPSKKTEMTEALQVIDDKNTIGRTGRSKDRKSLIGKVIVFSRSIQNKNVQRTLKGLSEDNITLKEAKAPKQDKIIKFSHAYSNIVREQSISTILKSTDMAKNVPVNLKVAIKHFMENRTKDNIKTLSKEMIHYFLKDINFTKKDIIIAISMQIQAVLLNIGYSRYYMYEINNKKYVNKLGYMSNKLKKGYSTFNKNSNMPDLVLKNIVDNYQNEYGYYFKQLLRFLIKQLINNKDIDIKLYEKYQKKIETEESIGAEFGWPDAFVQYYLASNKSDEITIHLNRIMKVIK